IEHYAGAFPVWLSPVQVELIPVTDDQIDYCKAIASKLKAAQIRAEVDTGSNRMAYKIRQAQEQKIPYMLVIGKREVESGQVSVRLRTGDDLGAMSIDDLIHRVRNAIDQKTGL
ncbi:MAG TPA: His/Gly/Thr/Pro-type tRNA ligase C-terminal domain-containing protein, partial [Phototrophicaceae bacterium]|nr:His/Gly/Thr/Pro-type tRNA ligase C-terminal domain-containing protein [Phototrophicaceae bacterium]